MSQAQRIVLSYSDVTRNHKKGSVPRCPCPQAIVLAEALTPRALNLNSEAEFVPQALLGGF